jgi:hypothetical protein
VEFRTTHLPNIGTHCQIRAVLIGNQW